jgi:hypothetical protein
MIPRVESGLPGGVVEDPVVVAADQHEVVQGGGAVVGPVSEVVGVAHHGWAGAGGEGAVVVAGDQGVPDRDGHGAGGTADVEDLTTGTEDHGDDLGVTGQPAQDPGGSSHPSPVSPVSPAVPVVVWD